MCTTRQHTTTRRGGASQCINLVSSGSDEHTDSRRTQQQLYVLWHVQLESVRALARAARLGDSSIVEHATVVNMLSFVGSLATQMQLEQSLVVETIFVEPTGPSVFSKISPAHWQSPRADRVISLVNLGLLGLQRRAPGTPG